MTRPALHLPPAGFERAFPFHFAFDRELRVVQAGARLTRLLPGLAPGQLITETLSLRRPAVPLDYAAIEQASGQLFILEARDARVTLRGDMLLLPEQQCAVFLGSPWIDSHAKLRELGLALNDFALHDPMVDLLYVLHTKDMAFDDTRGLTQRLEQALTQVRGQVAALQRSEALTRAVIDSAFDAIVTADADGKILEFNAAAEQTFGFARADVLGRSMLETVTPPHLCPQVEEILAGKADAELDTLIETVGERADGTSFPMELVVNRISGQQAPIFCAFARDISARVTARVALEEREQRLQAILTGAVEGIITIDANGTIESANPAAEATFGYRSGELAGQNVSSLMPEPHASAHDGYVRRYLATGEARVIGIGREVEGRRRDGTKFPMNLAVSEVRFGEQTLFIGMITDITARKEAERALAAARQLELTIGARIQQTLLYGRLPTDLFGIELAALTVASQQIDGDFYEVLAHGQALADLVVGDVMGKGVPAALLAAACKGHLLHAAVGDVGAGTEPREIMDRLQRAMSRQLIDLEAFITLAYLRVDAVGRRATLVDCGHMRTMHRCAATGEVTLFSGENMPLGFAASETITQLELPFLPGDVILLYSDGLTEAQDPQDHLLGEERLAAWLAEAAGLAPEALVAELRRRAEAFVAGGRFRDDLTCLAVRAAAGGTRDVRRLTSNLDELSAVRAWVREVCRRMLTPRLDGERTSRLELAVHEALTNVIRHAYGGERDRPIELVTTLTADEIRVEVRHWGTGLAERSAAEPQFDGSQDGGFGLYLIERAVDRVTYDREADGTWVVRMTMLRDAQ